VQPAGPGPREGTAATAESSNVAEVTASKAEVIFMYGGWNMVYVSFFSLEYDL
jgi:hypothetical protein